MRSILLSALLVASVHAHAATPRAVASADPIATAASVVKPSPSSDPWIDARLADVELYGERYAPAFADELARYQDAPRDLVTELQGKGWSPSQIYAACAIAKTSGRPCRVVADAWNADRGQRWDTVASKFGLSAGSVALQRMKDGIIATYGRWGRPVQADRAR